MLPSIVLSLYGPFSNSTAVSSLVGASSVFIEQVITTLLMIFALLAFSLQVSRGYIIRVLRKFTLRLAADIWWMVYVLLRDAGIFLTLLFGVSFFWPGTYQDYMVAVPFAPLAIDFFAFALVLLLYRDTAEDESANNLLTLLIAIGTFLLVFSFVFITQNPLQVIAPNGPVSSVPTVSASNGNLWGFLYNNFGSINAPDLSIYSFYVCFILLAIAGSLAGKWAFDQWTPTQRPPKPKTV